MAIPIFLPRHPNNASSVTEAEPNGRAASQLARGREVAALLYWTLALFLALALASFQGQPGEEAGVENWVGPVGAFFARLLVELLGVTAWAVPLEAALLGIPYVRGRKSTLTYTRAGGDVLIALLVSALVQVALRGAVAFGAYPAAGLVGELFGELGRSLFSTVGSFLVGFASLGLILIARAHFSFIATMHLVAHYALRFALAVRRTFDSLVAAWQAARLLERGTHSAAPAMDQTPHVDLTPHDDAQVAVLAEDDGLSEESLPFEELVYEAHTPTLGLVRREEEERSVPAVVLKKVKATKPRRLDPDETAFAPAAEVDDEGVASEDAPEPAPIKSEPVARAPKRTLSGPTIVDTSAALQKENAKKATREELPLRKSASTFRLPAVELLVPAKVCPTTLVDKDALLRNADLLVKTLGDYGVSGKVEDILPGPTITTFEMSPAAGTKVSKVASLADDLALALAKKVRIVAPIPGKNRIGFELPNEQRVPVNLRDLVEDRRFQALDVPLPVVLGRDIVGNPVYADLASMPHVIVAGATGAGKSVGLNVMLTSLLYRRSPEELKLLMIDPKVVELAPYDRIPHMLLPVVTDTKQASNALKWAVDEMERRYQLFADAGTRNITSYNAWVGRILRGEIKAPKAKTVWGKDHNGLPDEVPVGTGEEAPALLPESLPFIVIVVDEFADLMMQQGKEVEAAVARLAQKARAAGMHVILATQRPSVDVITGMIKANFPTRIAFRVAQKVDSRTILDEQGAEHLLGRGDMLIKLNGTNETRRVQCPMVNEEEVQLVTDHLRTQGEPVYDENILKPRDDEEGKSNDEDGEQDPMYDEAVRIVADTRRCSTSWLQRKLGLGYNRAARIVETMERRGLVGPANGAKDREILVQSF